MQTSSAFALARIKDKVAQAPKGDAPCWLSKGPSDNEVAKHRGRLNPVVSEEELLAFERERRIVLPEEYRAFLLEVGNGGLGPGYGLNTLAEAAENSPTHDLDKPFPFSFRRWEERIARFLEDSHAHGWREAMALELERHGGVPRNERPEREYAQPGVLYLARPDTSGYYADAYLVITGEERGMMWMYCDGEGWNPEAPTSEQDQKQIGKPPRTFFRWYEDWLDEILPKENAEPGRCRCNDGCQAPSE